MDFIKSITVEQWAAILGVVSFILHSLVATKVGKEINKFITRAVSVVVPVATVVATDPNVQAIVHNYLPTLAVFFTTYQGLYQTVDALAKKVSDLRSALPQPAASSQEQSF